MKRALLILLAAASVASAQTFITVTADTNRVVRTNFSLVRSQISDLSGASFAISNITGLQTALDGKLATNGSAAGLTNFPASLLTTNGSAGGLTNFPALLLTTNSAENEFPAALLRTNGNAAALTNFPALLLTTNSAESAFPAALLRTNGDGSGLTNLPNANLGSATGILPLANGGTGTNSAAGARTALELGTAATNDATAFQPANTNLTALATGDGSSLTNVTITDASTLTNFPAELLRTNGDAAGLTNFPGELLRTNGDGSGLTGVALYPAFSNNAGKVLAVATNETDVEWLPVSNTVTDASTLTNFPALILQTNSAETNFPAFLLRTNGSGAGLTNLTAANIVGTVALASNVSGTVAVTNGGTGASDVTNARINLLPSYTGNSNRVLALNSNATDVVWAVDGGGTANLTNVTGTLAVSNGGTGANTGAAAMTNLGIYFTEGGGHSAVTLGEGATMTSGSESAVVIGKNANANNNDDGIAIGRNAKVTGSTDGEGIAIGVTALVSNAAGAVQIGPGANSLTANANTIQFRSAGSVSETEWGYLANASTRGGYAMTNTNAISGSRTFVAYDGTNYSTNTVTFSNGIITGWTQ